MNLLELFVKIGVDDQASDKISSLSSKLGKGLKTAAKIGTAAVGAAAAGIAALTTAAVNNYAEYEQLVGGVETLFKQSADVVQGYASNAYKTAGLSANEYMETVTSFSASLLQSLDGDTAAAAEKANTAITDMADNANKMGTSMESIQNAYQGFAKQNYTMLDNLKLGYGGTKEEMQRLLDKANELNAQQGIITDYQIDSYADVVDAIHVVQKEMGITGTTADEAGRTISGAIGAMKSAWANLLTGLADGNANVGDLVGNLVTSIVGDGTESNLGVLGNILPAVKTALNGASTLVSEALPQIVEIIPTIINENLPVLAEAAIGIVQSLMDGISQNQGMLFETVFGVITYLATSFVTMLPRIVELGLNLIVSLANGIAESLPELVPTIVDVVLQIVMTLIENVGMLVDAAVNLISALAEGLIAALPILIAQAPTIIAKLVQELIAAAPQLLLSAAEIILQIVVGIANGLFELAKSAWDIVSTIAKGIGENISEFLNSAGDIIRTIVKGIGENLSELWKSAGDIIDAIVDGIEEMWDSVVDVGSQVVDKIREGISNAWEGLKNWFRGIWDSLFGNLNVDVGVSGSNNTGGGGGGKKYDQTGMICAKGLDYVPYNNFPATLHEGEAVLTAHEANAWRRGIGSGITVNQYISAVAQTPVQLASATAAYFEQARWAI